MSLLGDRILFTKLVAQLIQKAEELGFQCTLNEVLRDKRIAELNAASGAGISTSLHIDGLAVDLNLYDAQGKWLSKSIDHKPLGTWWKKQHARCRWGGDFKTRGDGGHYSLSPDGKRA